jgi:hypothetical protein
MLRITGSSSPSEQIAVPSEDDVRDLNEKFRRRHCIVLPGLLERALAEDLARRVEAAEFSRLEHEGIGVEACMRRNSTLAWLLLLVNDRRVVDFVRSITGCGPIGHFMGRVYRLEPGGEHHDSWHTDLGEGRMLAMSINLSTQPYEGGALELRDRQNGSSSTAKTTGIGDGLLFELGTQLEHRVLPVTGTAPRTVFAGWFKSGEDFRSALNHRFALAATDAG